MFERPVGFGRFGGRRRGRRVLGGLGLESGGRRRRILAAEARYGQLTGLNETFRGMKETDLFIEGLSSIFIRENRRSDVWGVGSY